MDTNRRRFLSGATVVATTALGIGAGSTVLADEHNIPVAIVGVNAEADTVTFENQGSSQADISGYIIDWEHNGPQTQTDPFPEGTTIEAGATFVVGSGYTDAEADFHFDYDAGRINNDETDEIALLTPDDSEVVTTSEEDTSTPTETPTATATETPEETDTETPEETPEAAKDGTGGEGDTTEEPTTPAETASEEAVEEDDC